MPAILLARHGQASFGAADYDVLSDTGAEQAAAVAEHLPARGVRVDRLVSGSLRRQRDTAVPIGDAIGLDMEIDARFDEYDSDGIVAAYARVAEPPASNRDFQRILEGALAAWISAGTRANGGESWPAFAARTRSAVSELAASLQSGQTALVVTSGGVLGAVCAALLGAPDRAFITLNRVMVNGGLTKLIVGSGGTTLVSVNEHAHLERPGRSLVTYR
ncbi:MAG: histidine phosphatase family protein [Solirubrobacteraceae bacterium]